MHKIILRTMLLSLFLLQPENIFAAEVLKLWNGQPPGKMDVKGPEVDLNKPTDRLVGGRKIIKLANVTSPEIHVYQPEKVKPNGSAVVVCPGGGFSILAWDLEGTEVAQWFNTLGITGIVLKYRTPTRSQKVNWKIPVQDAQRALSLVRHHADKWDLDPKRVGIMGFSAGGKTAAMTALAKERLYQPTDKIDDFSCKPNLALLIYPAYLVNKEQTALNEDVVVDKKSPAMFMVHAYDDPVTMQSSLKLMSALKTAGVASELHIYSKGGHGYGLRSDEALPIAKWPNQCKNWLRLQKWHSH